MIYAINKRTKEHRIAQSDWAFAGAWHRVDADPDGWIPWNGGECPLPKGSRCQLKDEAFPQEDGETFDSDAVCWGGPRGTTITAYRPILEKTEAPEWDGDGKPPVGTICEAQSGYLGFWQGEHLKAEVVAHRSDIVVCWSDEKSLAFYCTPDACRPLRTPAQRAEDETIQAMLRAASWANEDADDEALCFELYHAIRDGKIPGVKLEAPDG